MACVHNSKKEAIDMLETWLKEPLVLKRFISNLKSEQYDDSDIEFILESFDGNTNHIIEKNEK